MIVVKTVTWSIIVLVHGTVTVFVPFLLLYAKIEVLTGTLDGLRWLGLAPLIAGAVGIVGSAWHLTLAGKGTPAPFNPPKEFVVDGLYRYVRNPMYAADLSILVGESVLFESAILLVYAYLMLSVFHSFVVHYEEPTLTRKFGMAYEGYRKSVPRWIPRSACNRAEQT
jgi:protein-S-isoprenylcysteine O-methyltransferase Ste14